MSKSNSRISLEYWIARSVLACFTALPLRAALSAGAWMGRAAFYLAGGLRRTGRRNLELVFPELEARERDRLLHGCFENLGRLLGVFSHFAREGVDSWRKLVECQGLERLEAARQQGRGVILFTGHIGAWEMSSFALSLFDQPLSFLVRRLDNPRIEVLIDRIRSSHGNRTIDKRLAAREILRILNDGGTLGILVDLNTLDREAVFVDFFGHKAATTFMVAKLALRTNALVLPVFAPWDKTRKKFLLQIDEPLSFERGKDEQENVLGLTQLLTSVVETYVRRYPDQWLWIHRRWKTRPPGEPDIY